MQGNGGRRPRRGQRTWHDKKQKHRATWEILIAPPNSWKVSADKCKSEGAEMVVRKSDVSYYRGSRVMPMEGRTLGKTDLEGETWMRSTESKSETATKLERIRWLSKQDAKKEFHNLMHLFNEDALRECFNELDGKKATGADGIDKEKYRENVDENLKELVAKIKRMAYRPGPVRQVLIPKAGKPNEKRPLGICNFEDKIVQRMIQKVLEAIYDPQFLNCSYGFRNGKGCHDAIKGLSDHLVE